MATKTKASDAKVPVLKGKEAEDKVLDYMKRMNRPFGAVDVSANLKGAVPKAAAQKILIALAERGQLVQKTCGQYPFARPDSGSSAGWSHDASAHPSTRGGMKGA